MTKRTCSIHGTGMEKYPDVHLPRPRSRPTPTVANIGMYMRNTADIIPNLEYIRNANMNKLAAISGCFKVKNAWNSG